MERVFEQGGLSQEELIDGMRREVSHHQIFPVLCSSASHNIGGQMILDSFVSLFPSATEAHTVMGKDKKGETVEIDRRDQAFPSALVFKTFSDPFSGRVSLFRVYSGTFKSDTSYWNTTRDHEERVGKLQLLQGKQQVPVPELHAGDIGAVAKLKDVHTGDTLAAKDHPYTIDHIRYPEAAISFAIEAKSRGDEDKLGTAVNRIIEEDPTITLRRDEQTKEALIAGQGQLHVKIAGSLAYQEAMEKARATLLEPIMHVEITASSEYIGDIMGDLNSRRGRVEGVDADGDSQSVKARVPLSEMLTYGSTLRSITQGRGRLHVEYSHYEA